MPDLPTAQQVSWFAVVIAAIAGSIIAAVKLFKPKPRQHVSESASLINLKLSALASAGDHLTSAIDGFKTSLGDLRSTVKDFAINIRELQDGSLKAVGKAETALAKADALEKRVEKAEVEISSIRKDEAALELKVAESMGRQKE